MTATYSPALRKLLDNVETCPAELLLFFHNVPWTYRWGHSHQHGGSGGGGGGGDNRTRTPLTLIERITSGHAAALREVVELAAAWEALEQPMKVGVDGSDLSRFVGVRARFAQQVNDAQVFSKTITDFYYDLSRDAID